MSFTVYPPRDRVVSVVEDCGNPKTRAATFAFSEEPSTEAVI